MEADSTSEAFNNGLHPVSNVVVGDRSTVPRLSVASRLIQRRQEKESSQPPQAEKTDEEVGRPTDGSTESTSGGGEHASSKLPTQDQHSTTDIQERLLSAILSTQNRPSDTDYRNQTPASLETTFNTEPPATHGIRGPTSETNSKLVALQSAVVGRPDQGDRDGGGRGGNQVNKVSETNAISQSTQNLKQLKNSRKFPHRLVINSLGYLKRNGKLEVHIKLAKCIGGPTEVNLILPKLNGVTYTDQNLNLLLLKSKQMVCVDSLNCKYSISIPENIIEEILRSAEASNTAAISANKKLSYSDSDLEDEGYGASPPKRSNSGSELKDGRCFSE